MKIIVLAGGTSPEREVSLNSGRAVADALSSIGFVPIFTDIKDPLSLPEIYKKNCAEGVFIALHGSWGENGIVQAVCEAANIPYTGSGVIGSALAMNKFMSKPLLNSAGIKTPISFVATSKNSNAHVAQKLLDQHGKIFVKPNSGGSTVACSTVTSIDEYNSALKLAWQSEPFALVEEFIEGEEVTVPVFEDESGTPFALPVIHIKPRTGYYDYKNKYTKGATEYICPAEFSTEITQRLQTQAVSAHKALSCNVYSRIDFRLTPSSEIYALEANTAPGMTATSLVPKAAKAFGLEFPQFLQQVIERSFSLTR
ncbi:MAG: D-alanine--D-alanine ligase [Synergistaceae bacterium]|nr:D-alanine--D-alanine ligase [Synergistaceae bacterium]